VPYLGNLRIIMSSHCPKHTRSSFTGLLFKQLHVRADIADYYVLVSACWLKLLVPSFERDL